MLYLDNSSTTKVNEEVIKTMTYVMEKFWGNPSSLHEIGVLSEKAMKESRKMISNFLEVSPEEIIFTSGGTESSNIFIKGVLEQFSNRGKHIITTKIEHPAVYEVIKTYEKKGWRVSWLDVDELGIISLEELKKELSDETVLTAIMHVNNENGAIQPIEEASNIVKKNSRSLFFSDGVQGFLKVPLTIKKTNIDGYGFSGHKINGPKGIGGLYVNKKCVLAPVIHGGGQEKGLRPGTENVPSIVGLAKAVQIFASQHQAKNLNYIEKKNNFIELLLKKIPELKINSPSGSKGSPYILNCSLPNIQGETILHALEENNIYVSTGSACSGKDKSHSNVLKAMGIKEKYLKGAIRISMSLENWPKEEEINFFTDKLQETWIRLRSGKQGE